MFFFFVIIIFRTVYYNKRNLNDNYYSTVVITPVTTFKMYSQARSQKFAMGGLFGGSGGGAPSRRRPMGVWGLRPQLPEAGGLGAKPPAAGGTGVWGRSPQRSKILHFFAKITSFLGNFD